MSAVALYGRVSRDDGRQDEANQLLELRAWAGRMALAQEVVEYIDRASGSREDRPGLMRLLEACHRREVDQVLVWSLDRLTRNGVVSLALLLERFRSAGVVLRSLREPWLDTSSPLVAELLVSIFAWIGKQEREQLIARTKAGMARARAAGKRIGRERKVSSARIRFVHEQTKDMAATARALGVSVRTVGRRLQETNGEV